MLSYMSIDSNPVSRKSHSPHANSKMPYLFALLSIATIVLYLLSQRYSRGLNKYPGPFVASFTNLWKIWNARRASNTRNDMYVDVHEQYGDVVRIGPNTMIFASPRAITEIYGTKGSQQKSVMYDTFTMPVDGVRTYSLLSSTNQQWHDQQRRLINSAFSTTAILKYEPWVNDTMDLLICELKKRSHTKNKRPAQVDLHRWLAYFAGDVVSNLTYGKRTGFLETGSDVEGIQSGVQKVFRYWMVSAQMPIVDKLIIKNPILLWLQRHGFLRKTNPLLAIVHRHFLDRKQIWDNPSNKDDRRETLVDRFLRTERDNGEKVQMGAERHAITMVVAGSETTSITLSSIFYFLMKNPECYKKLEEEVDAVHIDKLDEGQESSIFPWATSQTMPYLDACIREAMRLHPVQRIPHERVVPEGGMTICGHDIPRGTNVGIFPTAVHRRKDIFGEDADVYRPERWLEDASKIESMKNSMFTFSYGRYNCLGQNISKLEMYKAVPTLIKVFKIQLLDSNWTWELIPGAFAIPKELPVELVPRRF